MKYSNLVILFICSLALIGPTEIFAEDQPNPAVSSSRTVPSGSGMAGYAAPAPNSTMNESLVTPPSAGNSVAADAGGSVGTTDGAFSGDTLAGIVVDVDTVTNTMTVRDSTGAERTVPVDVGTLGGVSEGDSVQVSISNGQAHVMKK